ncbi:MAG: hypothetical protein ACRCVJ_11810 [Clostridium sp.]
MGEYIYKIFSDLKELTHFLNENGITKEEIVHIDGKENVELIYKNIISN